MELLKKDILYWQGGKTPKSLREIAEAFSVSHGVIQRIKMGYEPKLSRIRSALKLPLYVTMTACPKCGQIHRLLKSCAPKPQTYHRIADMPPALLAWKIRHREEAEVKQ